MEHKFNKILSKLSKDFIDKIELSDEQYKDAEIRYYEMRNSFTDDLVSEIKFYTFEQYVQSLKENLNIKK